MGVKDDFFKFGAFNLGDGRQIWFWEGIWLGNNLLANEYPALYAIAPNKSIMVANVFESTPINLTSGGI